MSGPTTVLVAGNPAAVLLAAAAIRAAQAVAQAHEEAATQRAQRQAQTDQDQQDLVQATTQGESALQQTLVDAQATYAQLQSLAARLGLAGALPSPVPAPSATGGASAQAAHVRAWEAMNAQIRQILLTEAARQAQDVAPGPNLHEAAQSAESQARAPGLAQRLLARVAHLGAVPPSMAELAQELQDTPPGQRAELLATELRGQVQQLAEAQQQRELHEAQALVLEQSLRDLGYQVEPVTHTLFVQGGVVHFRRSDWGAYMVRLRVAGQGASFNFNVVRAVQQGQQERSVLDHLAEDRWCAEFPTLLKTLEARGMHLEVTRRLQAGEVPVQCVPGAQLPSFADEHVVRSQAVQHTRSLT